MPDAGRLSGPLSPASPVVAAGASPTPRVLLGSDLSAVRAAAAANTPQWQAFKARLDANLDKLVNHGAYQGSYLSLVADYALGYQAAKEADPARARLYADKAIALLKSAMRDRQKADWVTRQLLARGDGQTATFALPHAGQGVIPSSVRVYLGGVSTKAVVRGNTPGGADVVDYYTRFLKASDSNDGPGYAMGADWSQHGDLAMNVIDWSPSGREPAAGATYYVTQTSGFGATNTAFTLNTDGSGQPVSFTLAAAPGADKAVFVEYVYGTASSGDGTVMAYQQTSSGDGGFNNIHVDTTYTSRYLGKYVAIGYDWLYDYAGFTPNLRAEAENLLVRWSDFVRDSGYMKDTAASNYGVGGYVSRMFTALALSGGRHAAGDRLLAEMDAYRNTVVLPTLSNELASLKGGFWPEGWSYGSLASINLLTAGLAYERAGLGAASAERHWASEVVTHLLGSQATPKTVYDGGDWFAYPAPFPGKELFYVLGEMADSATSRAYANHVVQNYIGPQSGDWLDLMFRDPSAAASSWTGPGGLPLQDHATGTGLVTAREDWSYDAADANGPATFMSFQLGNLLWADHQSYTPGQLQLQRGSDLLLVNAAVLGNEQSGAPKSRLGNIVAIDDNGEGAQNYRWSMGYWYGPTGVYLYDYEAASDNSYVYAGGDYAAAYSRNTAPGAGGPASQLTRQVFYLRGSDLVLVYDRAATIKDSYPKQLQWHFPAGSTPQVLADADEYSDAWSVTSGSSKLFGRTFSSVPLSSGVSSVTVNRTAVPRLATNTASPTSSVRYVTALQAADGSAAGMAATARVASLDGKLEGVAAGDAVVLFAADGAVAGGSSYRVAAAAGRKLSHYVTGLVPLASYTLGGADQTRATASAEGVLVFTSTGTGVQQTLTLTPPDSGDATPPTATLSSAPPVSVAGAAGHSFTVSYSDDTAVDASSIDSLDVLVSGPGGFAAAATLVGKTGTAASITATYRVAPPGGSWDFADNGTYTVRLAGGQVKDVWGNNAAIATVVGSLAVAVPPASLSPTGILNIAGTASNDVVRIKLPATEFGTLLVVVNGVPASFDYAAISSIAVDTKAGDDTINIEEEHVFGGGPEAGAGIRGLSLSGAAVALNLSGDAEMTLQGTPVVRSLHLSDLSRLTLPTGGTTVLQTADLAVSESAVLDLAGGTLAVLASGAAQAEVLGRITALAASGRASGGGLVSSSGVEPGGPAVALNRRSLGETLVAALNGRALSTDTVIVRHTYHGDLDLDGKVSATDFFLMDLGASRRSVTPQPRYADGDVNYDGMVDADDYLLVDQAFLGQPGTQVVSPATPLRVRVAPRFARQAWTNVMGTLTTSSLLPLTSPAQSGGAAGGSFTGAGELLAARLGVTVLDLPGAERAILA